MLHALILLFAMKTQRKSLLERLVSDQQILEDELLLVDENPHQDASISSCAGTTSNISLFIAAKQAAARYIRQRDPGQQKESTTLLPLSGWAVREGYLTVAAGLLKAKGRPVNGSDIRAWTILHEAASEGDVEAVKFILSEKDTNEHLEDEKGRTAFEIAACNGHERVVSELILGGANPHGNPNIHPTLLGRVAEAGDAVIVRHMIDAGVGKHTSGTEAKLDALGTPCERGHMDVAQVLLMSSTEANAQSQQMFDKILQKAVNVGDLGVVEGLLRTRDLMSIVWVQRFLSQHYKRHQKTKISVWLWHFSMLGPTRTRLDVGAQHCKQHQKTET